MNPSSLSSTMRPPNQPPDQPLWPVRLISLLLLLQAASMVAGFIYYMNKANIAFDLTEESLVFESLEVVPQQLLDALSFGITFLPLVFLALLAALGFLFLHGTSWMMAMILQGFTLFLCLSFYFSTELRLIYPLMAYSTFMVLYLNSSGVRSIFRARNQSI